MKVKLITPILNVSNLDDSFEWFKKFGWEKCWDWGEPPSFGAVGSGGCEIFLCQDAQGGRGKGSNVSTFGEHGDETSDKGVWMSIWVEDLDEIYDKSIKEGLDVVFPPTDMPWGAREVHIRHPDGHVFRVSQ